MVLLVPSFALITQVGFYRGEADRGAEVPALPLLDIPPVDARLLAGIRVLYASGPEDFSSGGSGEALQPLRHGALLESTLDRTKEAYALRTAQAALALHAGKPEEDEGDLQ